MIKRDVMAAKKRWRDSTPGRWEWDNGDSGHPTPIEDDFILSAIGEDRDDGTASAEYVLVLDDSPLRTPVADKEFIAKAHQDIPDLADMLQRAMAYIASTPPNGHTVYRDCLCAHCEDRRKLIAEYEGAP